MHIRYLCRLISTLIDAYVSDEQSDMQKTVIGLQEVSIVHHCALSISMYKNFHMDR